MWAPSSSPRSSFFAQGGHIGPPLQILESTTPFSCYPEGRLTPLLRHATRQLPPRRRLLVREAFRRPDRAAGARLGGDPGRPPYADRPRDRLGQDAGGVPL